MKRLREEVSLASKFEEISISELRSMPGEILACVSLGKVYLVKKNGKPIAVLSRPPGEILSMLVDANGAVSFKP